MAANISIGASIAGTLVSSYGAYQQSRAAKQSASYNRTVAENNAKVAEWQAEDAIDRGRIREQEQRRKVTQLKGQQRAQLAATGFDVGEADALDILSDTAEFGELDALTVRSNAEREAYEARVRGINQTAQADLFQAQADNQNPALAAGTTLFAGAGSVADRWYRASSGTPRRTRAVV